MARINNFTPGTISGKLGDLVFFSKNGKTFVRSAGRRRTTPGPRELARREKFAMSIEIARSINKIPELKALWEINKSTKGSAFNAIQKDNYHRVTGRTLDRTPAIIPEAIFETEDGEKSERVMIEAGRMRFKLRVEEITDVILHGFEDTAIAAGVIFAQESLSAGVEPYKFLGLRGVLEKRGREYYVVMDIDGHTLRGLENYDKADLYFALVNGKKGCGNFRRAVKSSYGVMK